MYVELTMTKKIKGTSSAWESGELGEDEKYAKKANVEESTLDEDLELQMISIRLQKSLIDDLKAFAKFEGLGYQPLIRRLLTRYVDSEKRMIANRCIAKELQEMEEKEDIKEQIDNQETRPRKTA